jgi:tripartite-type tricarboxylate transporter receptor subunit TctC
VGVLLGCVWGGRLGNLRGRGAADAMNALLGNSVPSAILTLGELTNLHQAGKARILATFTTVRTADLPEVPTFTEIGYPAMQAGGGVAMFGPAGMDPALTERISKAVRDALDDPEVKAKIRKMGMDAKSSTPQELAAYDLAELERWRAVVKASGYIPE